MKRNSGSWVALVGRCGIGLSGTGDGFMYCSRGSCLSYFSVCPSVLGPSGLFNTLGYMDDTSLCINFEGDLPVFAANLQRARLLTNLFFVMPHHGGRQESSRRPMVP